MVSIALKPYSLYKDSGMPWLGKVPAHWEVRRQRNVVNLLVSNVDKHINEGEQTVRLCNYVDVYKNDFITENIPYMHATASQEEINRFRLKAGDVIITKDSETWDDIGVPALVAYEAPDLVCGYHLAILRPHKDVIYGDFLLRVLQSQSVSAQHYVSANGITRFGLSQDAIKSVRIPLPPFGEQVSIARFLDHHGRLTRRYIRAQRRLIALLEEQKQALIQRAVTRGLDPDVPLKDSGIEWLGKVPEHWGIVRIKHLLREVNARSVSGQETLLSLRMNHGLVPHDEHFARPGQASSLVGYKLVRIGQVVLNRLQANNGLVFASEISGVISPDYAVFDPIVDVDLHYLTALFRTPLMKHKFRVEAKGLGTGTSGFLRLYTDRFGAIPIPLPPRNEQSKIISELSELLKDLQDTIGRTQRQIDLVREYHTRLIADVVTGKLDVRGVSLPDPDEGQDLEPLDDLEEDTEPDDLDAEEENDD